MCSWDGSRKWGRCSLLMMIYLLSLWGNQTKVMGQSSKFFHLFFHFRFSEYYFLLILWDSRMLAWNRLGVVTSHQITWKIAKDLLSDLMHPSVITTTRVKLMYVKNRKRLKNPIHRLHSSIVNISSALNFTMKSGKISRKNWKGRMMLWKFPSQQ